MKLWIKKIWAETKADTAGLWREMLLIVRTHRKTVWSYCAGLLLSALVLWHFDPLFDAWVKGVREEFWWRMSGSMRHWGNFNDTPFFFLAVFIGGLIVRKRYWRRVALAMFMAACLAGISVNVLRLTTGRPRPKMEVPDRFTGPTINYKYQSFPSGHSATSAAASTVLLLSLPGVGVPALISGAAVVAASFYQRSHWATDCWLGAGWGVGLGLLFTFALRRIKD